MNDALVWIALIAALIISIVLPQYQIARTARKVIADMKERGAIGSDKAIDPSELNLVEAPLATRMLSVKNYRPKALKLLLKLNVAKTDNQGRVYLDASALAASSL